MCQLGNAETAIFKAIHVPFPLSELVSFGCPDSLSGYRIQQNVTTDDRMAADAKDLLSVSIRAIRGQAPHSAFRIPHLRWSAI